MPKDNIHHGGVEHREMHNVNGALFHAATWQGLEERGRDSYGSDGDRPFILTRSAFAGTQRLGALWTGDNKAEWPALKFSVPMCLSLSIAGLPFVGTPSVRPIALNNHRQDLVLCLPHVLLCLEEFEPQHLPGGKARICCLQKLHANDTLHQVVQPSNVLCGPFAALGRYLAGQQYRC